MADQVFKDQPMDPFTGKKLGKVVRSRVGSNDDAWEAMAAGVAPLAPTEEVPAGDEDAVLAWVGHDVERAKAALVAEHGRGPKEQRPSLIETLTERTQADG